VLSTPVARRFLTDAGYVLSGFPVALAGFLVAVIGLGWTASVFVVGVPALGLTLYAVRSFADLERQRIAWLTGVRVPQPAYRPVPPDAGTLRRLLNPIADMQSWLDLLHTMMGFAVATITFVLVTGWAAAGFYSILFGLSGLMFSAKADPVGGYLVLGVLLLITAPAVLRVCAWAQAGFGRLVLSGVAELQEKIVGLESERTTLAAQRDSAVSAEAIALRRLERDIHDGPQQRLVRLALDLGRAERLFEADPQAARKAVVEALAQTEETLDELRALSRGIAPPVLADRGLVAAVGSIAGRCPVPVALDAGDLGRLDPSVEHAAYFVVAEALANVAKHSQAGQCRVALHRSADRLRVEISDDGVGGAHPADGHGLAGLSDRAQAAGGTLTLHSPAGGPTTVTVELPWR